MSIFMARGYKDPFHRHVARSLANYFSEAKRTNLRQIIAGTESLHELDDLLTSPTVTAWGAKSSNSQDEEIFNEMAAGDRFIMRTGQPSLVEYIQQVDVVVDDRIPRDIREQLSQEIWGDTSYDLLWFSKTPITHVEIAENEFEEIISEVQEDFQFSNWFPSQSQNFKHVPNSILEAFGGEDEFLERLKSEGYETVPPNASHFFVLNAADNYYDVAQEHLFDFPKAATENADELIEAENDGVALIVDEDEFVATARLGNIEGSRRDGSLHKAVLLLDWEEVEPFSLDRGLSRAPELSSSTPIFSDVLNGSATLPENAVIPITGEIFTKIIDDSKTVEQPVSGCETITSETAPYYWVNQSDTKEINEEYLQAPNTDHWAYDLGKLEQGDIVFNYTDGELRGYSTVAETVKGRIIDGEELCYVEVEFHPFDPKISFAEVFQELLRLKKETRYYPISKAGINQHYLYNLTEEAGEYILSVAEDGVQPDSENTERLEKRLEAPEFQIDLPANLHFPGGESARLKRQIDAALNSGKHIIFTGPPGTGKSKLAKTIGEQVKNFDSIDGYTFTTATAEWTTFDTIGGYVPDQDDSSNLQFDPRLFLQCFRDNGVVRNEWLVIDELNRADIDKAFGQLFSVLSHDSVELPYERQDRIKIDWVDETVDDETLEAIASDQDRFPVTPAWRLLGTMNTFDKTSLYELSYAFMRRFNFIHVGVPDLVTDDGAVKPLLDPDVSPSFGSVWKRESPGLGGTLTEFHEELAVLWEIINRHRSIGPSIMLDVIRHIDAFEGGDKDAALSSAVIGLVFPQLEGMRDSEIQSLLEDLQEECALAGESEDVRLIKVGVDGEYLQKKAVDMFGIPAIEQE